MEEDPAFDRSHADAEPAIAGDATGPSRADPSTTPPATRTTALLEVILCSGYPTQIALAMALSTFGWSATDPDGSLSLGWVVTLSLADAVVLLVLITYLLHRSRDRFAHVFLGTRPLPRELAIGVPLIVLSLGVAIVALSVIHAVFPGLRNVPDNPLQDLLRSPVGVLAFSIVAIVSGAIREEIQRAFILYRFEQHLGGAWIGLVAFSVAFGLGHQLQGWDAAIVTGLLGALWGAVYVLRGSIVAAMVAHAGFNLAEIALALGGLGDGVV